MRTFTVKLHGRDGSAFRSNIVKIEAENIFDVQKILKEKYQGKKVAEITVSLAATNGRATVYKNVYNHKELTFSTI